MKTNKQKKNEHKLSKISYGHVLSPPSSVKIEVRKKNDTEIQSLTLCFTSHAITQFKYK